MIGIDTNVLIRYIVQDEPEQARQATTVLEAECTRESPGFISHIVLCEVAWVLRRGYRYDRSMVCRVLRELLRTVEFQVEREDLAWNALEAYESGAADFSDYLLAYTNTSAGVECTVTFDQNAGKHPLFRLISPATP